MSKIVYKPCENANVWESGFANLNLQIYRELYVDYVSQKYMCFKVIAEIQL